MSPKVFLIYSRNFSDLLDGDLTEAMVVFDQNQRVTWTWTFFLEGIWNY